MQLFRFFRNLIFGRPVSDLHPDSLRVALCFWMHQVQQLPGRDYGEHDPIMQATMLWGASNVPPADEAALLRFADYLTDEIHQQYRRERRVELVSDYGPREALARVARAAGIPAARFPFKTSLAINERGKVRVSCGYQAPGETLFDPDRPDD